MFGFVRIKKCCAWGSYLDESYNCVPTGEDNVEAEATFRQAIKDLGRDEVTLEVEDNSWRRCDRKELREVDVLHILKDINSSYAYAIIDLDIVDSPGETEEPELLTSGLKKMKYLCLDLDLELPAHLRSITALICLTPPSASPRSWLRKCCPPGWDLSASSLECEPRPELPAWPSEGTAEVIDPRTLSPATELEVIPGNTSCGPGHLHSLQQVRTVLSDGRMVTGEKLSDYHCVDRSTSEGLLGLVCSPSPCSHPGRLCVSKCCPPDMIFLNTEDTEDQQMCGHPAQQGHLWTNTRGLLHHTNLSVISDNGLANLSLSHNFLLNNKQCQNFMVQVRNDKHLLISNGSLYDPETEGFKNNFCIDNGITSDGKVVEVVLECYHGDHHRHHPEQAQDQSRNTKTCLQKHGGTFRLVNTISCSLSVVFLSLTALVYIFVPDLNYLQGKIILSNVLAIFFLSVFLLVVYNKQSLISHNLCISLGYFGYFCTMSMFSWMTIMSFDVCWMLKQSKVPRRDSKILRFLAYSLLGWGISGLLTLQVAVIDHVALIPPQYKPNIGLQHCFVQSSVHGLYLHLPISVFMILNGILFVTTICIVYR